MVTLQDIADRAGVSRVTVSVILNNKGRDLRISENTCRRVLEIADQLGYCRNEIARSVVTGKTNVIGFMAGEIATQHGAVLLDGIMKAAYENNYVVKVIYAGQKFKVQEIVNVCRGHRLAGLIVCETSYMDFFPELHRKLSVYNIPVIVATDAIDGVGNVIRVCANNYKGGFLAFRHLYEKGHRAFCLAASYRKSAWVSHRLKGFIATARDAGVSVPSAHVYSADHHDVPDMGRLINRIKAAKDSAVFCVSDYLALTVIGSLQMAGLRVPEDVAVVGYGNLSFCQFARPTITTIEEHLTEIGRRMVTVLFEIIKSGAGAGLRTDYSETLDVELIAQESTNCIK